MAHNKNEKFPTLA